MAYMENNREANKESNKEDHVRVYRVLEYSGPRAAVEQAVAKSLHGYRKWHERTEATVGKRSVELGEVRCYAMTMGEFAEVIPEPIPAAIPGPSPNVVAVGSRVAIISGFSGGKYGVIVKETHPVYTVRLEGRDMEILLGIKRFEVIKGVTVTEPVPPSPPPPPPPPPVPDPKPKQHTVCGQCNQRCDEWNYIIHGWNCRCGATQILLEED